ncbi:MAG: tripartite tricarboxylate transporter substrate binding protein, partial [Spirochaetales bacterium]|nr:tripartite tricarboxylate transporter substrate binding protein [Spirochaetales bacterium]
MLASVGVDNVLFVTKADSPYQTYEQALEASKANPGKLTVGCADDIDKVCVYNINSETGAEFNTVYFNSAGEIATAILGGHIDFGMFNPSECAGLVEGGQLKAIATMAEKRLGAPFADAPSFVELGYPNLVYYFSRGMLAGAGMSREAQLWWSDTFAKVCASEKWQNYCDQNGIENRYMNCDDYRTFYLENEKMLLETAKKAGAL